MPVRSTTDADRDVTRPPSTHDWTLNGAPVATTSGRWRLDGGPVDRGTFHLVLLRFFMAFGWSRALVEKLGEPAWWDGTQLTAFLADVAPAGLPGFATVLEATVGRVPRVTAVIVAIIEALIAFGILTGFEFDKALLSGIGLATIFLAAGAINPAAFYVVIQLALLDSPAGDVYVLERSDRMRVSAWAPWTLGIAGLMTGWSLLVMGPLTPGSVHDPGAVMMFLGLFSVTTISILWYRSTRHSIDLR